MALNTHKTKSVLVTGKRLEKKILGKALKIACNGNEIEQVTSQMSRCFSATFDQDLNHG